MPRRRRTRPLGSFRHVAWDEALQAQREALLAGVPAPRRHRVLGRPMDQFTAEELAALTRKIQDYVATGRCRLTSSDGASWE